jgi:uncharacterized protein YndB with AHSA1/START domain
MTIGTVEMRGVRAEVVVDAPREQVFDAWTTEAGVRSFFAPQARIEAEAGGRYELYFMPDAPAGTRGSEGCVLLALEAPRLLSFSWNAPPTLPTIREQRTVVIVRIVALEDRQSRVILTHVGWGEGDDWREAERYFDRAWCELVLPRLARSFTEGPLDWGALQG